MRTITHSVHTNPNGDRVTTVLVNGTPVEREHPAETHERTMRELADNYFKQARPPKERRHWNGDTGTLRTVKEKR